VRANISSVNSAVFPPERIMLWILLRKIIKAQYRLKVHNVDVNARFASIYTNNPFALR